LNLEIVTTPNENLKETGFGTLKACHNFLSAVKKLGYNARLNICAKEEDLQKIVERRPDLVVLAVKYLKVKEKPNLWLSDYFSGNEVNYTGSTREVLRFDSDKVLAKEHLRAKGIRTAEYFTTLPGQYRFAEELPLAFPLFLKPIDAANGNGIDDSSYVTNFEEFKSKVSSLHESYGSPVLVEKYLMGREFTSSIARAKNDELIVSTVELIPPLSENGIRILGMKTKSEDTEKIRKTDKSLLVKNVSKLAVSAFTNLNVRDFGRIDIKTDQQGQCYFMEANLVPGMTYGSSYFPKSFEIEKGISYENVVQLILEGAVSRIPKFNITCAHSAN